MKNLALVIAALCLACAPYALAANPKPAPRKTVLLDLSSESLIDSATATAVVSDAIPAAVWKLYPPRKWGFVSQVAGGFTADGICVVTARVMLAPLTVTNGVIMRPAERATAFDAKPHATEEECKAIARAKLKEAIDSVVSGLVRR
jgi:hypothetical protein